MRQNSTILQSRPVERLPVLITDDSREDILLAERTLRECKILNPVRAFSSGTELLNYFSGEFALPVVLLLDMVMTPPNGTEVLKQLRHRGLTKRTVVVMLSGVAEYKVLQEGYQLGARTFLVKPLKCDDLTHLVNNVPGLALQTVEGGYVMTPAASRDQRDIRNLPG